MPRPGVIICKYEYFEEEQNILPLESWMMIGAGKRIVLVVTGQSYRGHWT